MLSPTELAELRAKAPALIAAAKRTVTAVEVRSILTPLVLVFGISAAAETSTFWSTYATVLAPLHPAALKAGCDAYLTLPNARFFPKPGELLDLGRRARLPLVAVACHAAAALRYEPPKQIERAAPHVAAKVQADLARALKRSPPPKPFTAPPTPTDEHGLSPAMAAKMNRQEAA